MTSVGITIHTDIKYTPGSRVRRLARIDMISVAFCVPISHSALHLGENVTLPKWLATEGSACWTSLI